MEPCNPEGSLVDSTPEYLAPDDSYYGNWLLNLREATLLFPFFFAGHNFLISRHYDAANQPVAYLLGK